MSIARPQPKFGSGDGAEVIAGGQSKDPVASQAPRHSALWGRRRIYFLRGLEGSVRSAATVGCVGCGGRRALGRSRQGSGMLVRSREQLEARHWIPQRHDGARNGAWLDAWTLGRRRPCHRVCHLERKDRYMRKWDGERVGGRGGGGRERIVRAYRLKRLRSISSFALPVEGAVAMVIR